MIIYGIRRPGRRFREFILCKRVEQIKLPRVKFLETYPGSIIQKFDQAVCKNFSNFWYESCILEEFARQVQRYVLGINNSFNKTHPWWKNHICFVASDTVEQINVIRELKYDKNLHNRPTNEHKKLETKKNRKWKFLMA